MAVPPRKTGKKSFQPGKAPAKEATNPSPRQRRSFSQKNLDTTSQGPLGEMLTQALWVPAQPGYTLTHSFHSYPGRFHPNLPRVVLKYIQDTLPRPKKEPDGLPPSRFVVLDPFMGGGTTLVESMLLGMDSLGNDLNPVAVLVARERTRPRTPAQVQQLMEQVESLAVQVGELKGARRGPRVRLPGLDKAAPFYQPHLLAEMIQWIRLINDLKEGPQRQSLRAVFSSLVVKFSNLRSDTSHQEGPVNYPKGAVSRFMEAKCGELAKAQAALADRLPRPAPRVALTQENARLLPSTDWGCADCVLTSPPYPGTYDYAAHHRLRMDWLGLDSNPLEAGEIGSRRDWLSGSAPAGEDWEAFWQDVWVTFSRVVKPGGQVFLVVGDWLEGGRGVDSAQAFAPLARLWGWEQLSRASVRRETFAPQEKQNYGKRGKWEHLLHFARSH
ncbi:MAG: hypothetical protein OEW12_01125 [Deltaproteobacteria bacterium]|nr:hypothetical protein [Deltaproteobacteria bacterium]